MTNNIIPLNQGNPWRLTGIALKAVKLRYDESGEVTDGFQLTLEFLDREPQTILTKGPQKGYRHVGIPIPKGVGVESFYDLLRALPDEIEKHLNPEPPEAS